MKRAMRLLCECGGEIPRPLPTHCPHCGAQIVGVRRNVWPLLLGTIVILGGFALLVVILARLVGG